MKAIGIIAEYNPFTNGHLYHLNTIKEKYPDHVIIVVMNGSFTQRGIPSIIDKWKRTEIILNLGVDLVIELPFPFATQSADIFAYGAITLLEECQAEKVIFGSESNSIEDLVTIAKAQIDNPDFDKLVKVYSKLGTNYPTAISNAIYDLTNKKVEAPNDLLGVSYIKTILKSNYRIRPELIKRNNNYHNNNLETFSSASSIREALKRSEPIQDYVPNLELNYLNNLHFLENYFPLIKYKIISEDDLNIYQTVEEGIEHKIKKEITNCNNLDDLINGIKSKRYTHNKITRMLTHILCNFTKEKAKKMQKISYLRILGFNDKGKAYLNSIKKDCKLNIISKIKREKDEMLDFEIEVTKIYDIIYNEGLTKKEFEKIIYMKGE